MNWNAYYRLGRLDKPIGIFLLWAPTAWALWIANQGHPPLKLVLLFFLGTVLMRTAGCVSNDLTDRNIDIHVERTKNRPITSGEISVKNGLIFLLILLVAAALILLALPPICLLYALLALFITIIYPFCKRIISAPQVVLGLAFSMGIPMAYAASKVSLDRNTFLLLLINFLWTIAYDTQYALADIKDDLRIGVKSTAIWFGSWAVFSICILQILVHTLWLLLAFQLIFSYIIWAMAGLVFIYQYYLIVIKFPSQPLAAFLSNACYGIMLWIALI
jgi:4-hydroxybenzoate polyprenyltransferase